MPDSLNDSSCPYENDDLGRGMQRFLDEKRYADTLREPIPSSLPRKEAKQVSIPGNDGFQYTLPEEIEEVTAVSYPKDDVTSVLLNDEDYSIDGNQILFTDHRPLLGEFFEVTYY